MVNWNGDVAPCCFDKDVDFKMGSAFEKGPSATFGGADNTWIFVTQFFVIEQVLTCAAIVQKDIVVCFLMLRNYVVNFYVVFF